jgi:hypothetical protein
MRFFERGGVGEEGRCEVIAGLAKFNVESFCQEKSFGARTKMADSAPRYTAATSLD